MPVMTTPRTRALTERRASTARWLAGRSVMSTLTTTSTPSTLGANVTASATARTGVVSMMTRSKRWRRWSMMASVRVL